MAGLTFCPILDRSLWRMPLGTALFATDYILRNTSMAVTWAAKQGTHVLAARALFFWWLLATTNFELWQEFNTMHIDKRSIDNGENGEICIAPPSSRKAGTMG